MGRIRPLTQARLRRIVGAMDLGLDIRTRGRPARPVLAEQVRELSPADLGLLDSEKGVKAPSLLRIRDSHHAVARALAEGLTPAEVSIRTGYSGSRISILQADPAFQDLVEVYRVGEREAFDQAQERIRTAALTALTHIEDQLEDDPDSIPFKAKLDLFVALADRGGLAPPKSAGAQVTVNVTASRERINAARARAFGPDVIEGTVLPLSLNHEESVP